MRNEDLADPGRLELPHHPHLVIDEKAQEGRGHAPQSLITRLIATVRSVTGYDQALNAA
ncbi:hypothetical protein [Allokutzneria albata]|uniref:hypothetical protein n=1 Tax=Allokutzneria albata TaxID=211114 RepID=UPI0012DF1B85|nr:hypothetical protein [Allokutzneria albata]